MKRTPLKRKTPLKSKRPYRNGNKQLLRRCADSKKDAQQRYDQQCAVENAKIWVRCAETGAVVRIETRQRHHVNRRLNGSLFIYAFITAGLHEWIESHSKKARELGWLRNQGQGYPIDKNQPQPWKEGTLVGQELLDEIEGR